jgi:type VI secretion system protein ImpL
MIERLTALRSARWFPSFLLLCAGLIVIWFVGPRIAIDGRPLFAPASVRIGMMSILLLGWCCWHVGRWATSKIDIRLATPPADEADSAENAILAELQAQIVRDDALARRRLRRRSLRGQPRYLLLGEPGVGKHALLQQTGLGVDQPLGMPPCSWYFGERATVLATEPGLPDKAWQRLLRPLGFFRRQRLFNGVVFALDATTILQATDRDRQNRTIAQRDLLRAILRRLGPSTPVYLVITHCDALAGFHAYFGDMPAPQRAQPWGLNLPLTDPERAATANDAIPAGLDRLTGRLHAGVIDRLQALADKDDRARLIGFPLQFAGLGQRVLQWVEAVCAHSHHYPDIRLRGFYFTSTRQQGMALQPWQGELALSLDPADSAVPSSRLAYFTAGLLDRVLLPEADLATRSRLSQRAQRWRLVLAGTGLLLVGALALHGIFEQFDRQRVRLIGARQYGERINILARQGVNLARPQSMLPLLDATAASDDAPAPFWPVVFWRKDAARLDTWQADGRRRILRQTFSPYVMSRLASRLDDAQTGPVDRYQALRLYLMLGDPARLDGVALRDWLVRDLSGQGQTAGTSEEDERLWRHAEAWVRQAGQDEGLVPDAHLVERARKALAVAPRAPMWWGRLDARLAETVPGQLTLGQMAGRGAGLVLTSKSGQALSSGVPLRFTQAGYTRYLQLRDTLINGPAGPDWVLGTRIPPHRLDTEKQELDALYFSAYIQAWDTLLADVTLSPLDNRQDSGQSLRLLASPDSPLRRFLIEAGKQTRFSPDNPITQHFSGLQTALTAPPGSKQTALDAVQAQLGQSAAYMDATQSALQHGMPPPVDDALGKLRANADAYPAPLGTLLQGLVRQSGETQRLALTTLWQNKVVSFCRRALDHRFPFAANADAEVTLDDFSRLFRPGGLIDDFFQKNLASQVDSRGGRWRLRPSAAPSLTPAALQMFQRAAAIRDAFFPDGGNTLAIGFDLIPDSLDAGSARMRIDMNGQTLRYAHGPVLATEFKWPGSAPQMTRVELASADNGQGGSLEYRGAWGMFRLIRQAAPERLAADSLLLHLSLHGQSATVRLNAHSVNNPFDPNLLQGFRCNQTL